MIKAVIFDVDGVLIDSFEVNLKFIQDLLPKFGYPAPKREDYKNAFNLNLMEVIRLFTKSNDENEIRKIWEMGKSDEIPVETDLLKMPDGAEETVKLLSEKYLLGIVSSRIQVFSSPHLRKLEKYFKAVVSYGDTKNHKPHPEPLFLAASKLNVDPSECVYIGDAKTDIEAAKSAGMKMILYAKNALEEADATTFSFKDMPEIIESFNN